MPAEVVLVVDEIVPVVVTVAIEDVEEDSVV